MPKLLIVSLLAASAAFVAAAPALAAAGGGMGDPSTILREKNAICEMQRRGVGPLSPDLCLPELPPGPAWQDEPRRRY